MPSLCKRPQAKALAALALALAVSTFAGLPVARAGERPAGLAVPVAVDSRLQAEDFIQQVVTLTNQERAAQGLPPLALEPALCRSAEAHNQDMASHDFFSHTGSDGSTVDQRIKAAGYDPLWAYGENIAAGQLTPEEVVRAWMNSEGHRANILSPYYEHIGVSYVYQPGTTYLYYWTQDFASHLALDVQATPQPPPVPPTPVPTQPPPASPTLRPTQPPTIAPTSTPSAPSYMGIALAATAAPALPALAPDSHLPANAAPDRARQVVELLNQARAGAGCPPLSPDPALAQAAQVHSADMASHNLFSHTGSDGSTAEARVTAAGFGPALAESIAGGQATAEEVVGAWLANPKLRDQILSPGFARAGVGYAYHEGSTYRHYWTLDLAADGPAPQANPAAPAAQGWLQRWVSGLLRRLGLARGGS